ncbi:solute carrier family 66 member 2-like isoform X1 [Mytilus galloprovincialis]|uniref:solute carrier family 66 member 2-like isoform X1 n=1 Tax=Mytilus galloprovincialis TaxID=29158 RepID=UPI003F7BE028
MGSDNMVLSAAGLLGGIELPEFTILNIISWICSAAMIFGGVVPFIPQYRDIQRSGNADGFSPFVCLTLLIANILRIMFWFGKHYELPLLAQSIIMLFAMMALVHLCVHVRRKTEIIVAKQHKFTDFTHSGDIPHHGVAPPEHTFFDFDWDYFWMWTDFHSYVEFIFAFIALFGLITYLFLYNMYVVETIGFLAVFAEAMLGAPQFYRNFTNKSTQGMSKKMVGFWTMGDIFKTGYFIVREAPPQFWICGMLQVSIDISIFLQVYIYRNLSTKSKL